MRTIICLDHRWSIFLWIYGMVLSNQIVQIWTADLATTEKFPTGCFFLWDAQIKQLRWDQSWFEVAMVIAFKCSVHLHHASVPCLDRQVHWQCMGRYHGIAMPLSNKLLSWSPDIFPRSLICSFNSIIWCDQALHQIWASHLLCGRWTIANESESPMCTQDKYLHVSHIHDPPPRCPPSSLSLKFDSTTLQHVWLSW
jgi:hypothetical protein